MDHLDATVVSRLKKLQHIHLSVGRLSSLQCLSGLRLLCKGSVKVIVEGSKFRTDGSPRMVAERIKTFLTRETGCEETLRRLAARGVGGPWTADFY